MNLAEQQLEENKKFLIAAHRSGDQRIMRALSQERERLKKLVKKSNRTTICKCGLPKSFNAPQCRVCSCRETNKRRRKPKLFNENAKHRNKHISTNICHCGRIKSPRAKQCKSCYKKDFLCK